MIDTFIEFERLHVRPKPGRVLIVGSRVYGGREDRHKRFANALGVDMLEGPGVDVVCDLEMGTVHDLNGTMQFAHIECVSVLEHSMAPWLMAKNLVLMMERGGTIFVTVPFVWRVHAYPDDYWRFTPRGLTLLFGDSIVWDVMLFANHTLIPAKRKISAATIDDLSYFPRTEVYAFGRRRA